MPINIDIPTWKTPRLPLGQKVIIGYNIGVLMFGLMTLKIKGFSKNW
jgi:hypothetical protein